MKIQLPLEILTIINTLETNNFQAYLVGGALRDYLLGNNPKDFDIATSAKTNDLERIFSNYQIVKTGIKYGTLTIVINNLPIEVTTYRYDGVYNNNRQPIEVKYLDDINQDLLRRDFTINALAYNPNSGLLDICHGLNDLENKTIKTVGNPDLRFQEDPLRILRAIRFSTTLDFTIEVETKISIFKNKDLLKKLSYERIYLEFIKVLLDLKTPDSFLEYLDVFSVVLPQLNQISNLNNALLNIVNSPKDLTLRISLLLININNHKSAEAFLNILKVSNYLKDRVLNLISYQNLEINLNKIEIKYILKKMGEVTFNELLSLQYHSRKISDDELLKIKYILNEIIANQEPYQIKHLTINGNDLKQLDIQGSEIGILLDKILNNIILGKISNEKKCIINWVSNYQTDNH